MTLPRISIIIPSLNQARFIGETIDSILRQGYPNLELIVVDGGSTDGSVDVVRRYVDRIAYWVSEPDRGQTHAINKGMAHATGALRAYLNSDDLYLPGALHAVAQAYLDKPSADIIHGRCRTIDENSAPLSRVFNGDIGSPARILDLWSVWFRGQNVVQPEVFWTARLAERIGPFDETYQYAMDYDYWRRAIVGGAEVVRLSTDIAAFRLWEGQKSIAAQKAADELRASAYQSLSASATPISWRVRQRLLADWTFDEVFAKAGQAAATIPSRPKRIMRMAGVAVTHPRLLLSRGFRNHARKRARALLGLRPSARY